MGRVIQAYRITNTASTQLLARHNQEVGRRFLSFAPIPFGGYRIGREK
jgi:hypothetical protein